MPLCHVFIFASAILSNSHTAKFVLASQSIQRLWSISAQRSERIKTTCNMAKKVSKSTAPAVDTAKPKKIVFDDEGVPEGAGYLGAALEAGPSGTTSDQDDLMDDDDIEEGQDGDDDNDDDDDAPEAVGLAVGKQAARKEEQNAKA